MLSRRTVFYGPDRKSGDRDSKRSKSSKSTGDFTFSNENELLFCEYFTEGKRTYSIRETFRIAHDGGGTFDIDILEKVTSRSIFPGYIYQNSSLYLRINFMKSDAPLLIYSPDCKLDINPGSAGYSHERKVIIFANAGDDYLNDYLNNFIGAIDGNYYCPYAYDTKQNCLINIGPIYGLVEVYHYPTGEPYLSFERDERSRLVGKLMIDQLSIIDQGLPLTRFDLEIINGRKWLVNYFDPASTGSKITQADFLDYYRQLSLLLSYYLTKDLSRLLGYLSRDF